MSRIQFLAIVLATAALISGPAVAQVTCTVGTAVRPGPTLQGKTVCAVRGSDRWQEFHEANGALIDYKKGPTDPVDPSKQVGTWSVNGGLVSYTYGSNTYTYRLCDTGAGTGPYNFEPAPSGNLVEGATLRDGPVSCGF